MPWRGQHPVSNGSSQLKIVQHSSWGKSKPLGVVSERLPVFANSGSYGVSLKHSSWLICGDLAVCDFGKWLDDKSRLRRIRILACHSLSVKASKATVCFRDAPVKRLVILKFVNSAYGSAEAGRYTCGSQFMA